MNLKPIFIILALFGSILIAIGLYQQKQNTAAQHAFKEQQAQYQHELLKRQAEQDQRQQERQDTIDKQREQTFNSANSQSALSTTNTPSLPADKRKEQQHSGFARFCDMHQTYATYLMQHYQAGKELPDNSQTTDLLEKEFLDGVLQRLQQFPKVTDLAEQQKISAAFAQQEKIACMQFLENLG